MTAIVEQKNVEMYGDEITAVRASDNRIYASLTQICNALGVDAQGQCRPIGRWPILFRGNGMCKIHTPSEEDLKGYTFACLLAVGCIL